MRSWMAALIALLVLANPATARACEIEVVDAWIRPAPPGVDRRAAYVTLRNSGTETCRMMSVSSPSFRSVSIHRTQIVDGIARMRRLGEVEIAPGGMLSMAPGGIHLMLMGRPPDPQAPIELDVTFSDGDHLPIELRLEVSP
jgi:periplasmic copper chaperone A